MQMHAINLEAKAMSYFATRNSLVQDELIHLRDGDIWIIPCKMDASYLNSNI